MFRVSAMTINELIANIKIRASGRTRYEGQKPRVDEMLVAEIERLRAELDGSTWADKPLPEDAAIDAAHPLRTDTKEAHARYTEAMRLVGARRSKGGLVEMVNWLLAEKAAAVDGLRAEIAAITETHGNK